MINICYLIFVLAPGLVATILNCVNFIFWDLCLTVERLVSVLHYSLNFEELL